ncbi:MAG TPA: sodium:proton antiporter [Polyangiaceae bacterium]|jgi:NhaP-type Na+/H+ or K+/H+ antiporter
MGHALDQAPLVAAMAMFAGVVSQVVARHVDVPGIVLLLVAGVVLGPDVANVIRPEALGHGLEGVVGMAVAVILFEGGLSLDLRVLRRQQRPIRRLVLVGSIITSLGGALFAHELLGWDWRRALLFGTLVIVTGPTVINPLLRRVHASHGVETILEAEGIFIDAVGATIAVVALEVLLAPPGGRLGTAILGVGMRFGVGTLVGLVGGAALAVLFRFRSALPEGLANVTALASAIMIFEASNALTPESGITAVILAGMVVGHTRSHDLGELRAFKEQLTVLLVATLFVLLAADVRLVDVRALGVRGGLTVLALIVVVRPANVLASTLGTGLALREKAFLAWLAPRGIVAAAVSSLFAQRMDQAGIAGGPAMRALVFLVIGTTVVVQGMTAGAVASLLGLRLPREIGYAILGAHVAARKLGAALRQGGEEVVLIDTNPDSARAAEEEGFKVVFGDGLDERALVKARVESRRACVGATTNESVNFLFARKVHERARGVATFVALERKEGGVSEDMVKQSRAHILLAGAAELGTWSASAGKKPVGARSWWAKGDAAGDAPSFAELPPELLLPLTVTRREVAEPLGRTYRAKSGDRIDVLFLEEQEKEVAAWLQQNGWSETAG